MSSAPERPAADRSGLRAAASGLFLARPSTSRLQLDSLDGLRGLAALAVMVSHLELLGIDLWTDYQFVGYAKAGVYLFFSLSAFLLTLLWLRLAEPWAPGHWLRYGLRRVLRIYPLYLFVLVATWATLALWPGYQQPLLGRLDLRGVLGHLLLVRGDGVFWTISVEFRYYLVLPFVALAMRALRARPAVVVTAVLLVVVASRELWPPSAYPLNTLRLGVYLPIFLLGSLAAFVHWSREERPLAPSRARRLAFELVAWCALAGVVALNAQWWDVRTTRLERGLYFAREYTLYGLLWAIFLAAHLGGTGWLRGLFARPAMRFCGAISFSVYLLHPAVIFAIRDGVEVGRRVRFGLGFAAVLAVSALTYLAIERPCLELGARLASRIPLRRR